MKLLFICNAGLNRSPTGAEAAAGMGHEAKSAGIRAEGDGRLKSLLEWAEVVFVMEKWMQDEIAERFPGEYLKKRILVLDIPDIYSKGQPELVELLRGRIRAFFG